MASVTDQAHQFIRQHVLSGETVIDATAGNGHDTLFLAELVTSAGAVFSVDLQPEACERTKRRIWEAGYDHVQVIQGDHRLLASLVPREQHGRIGAIMFNLGYLPGGDKQVITHPESTQQALDASLTLLRPGGVLTVIVYRGHPGGLDEAKVVGRWFELAAQHGNDWTRFPAPTPTAPQLYALVRQSKA